MIKKVKAESSSMMKHLAYNPSLFQRIAKKYKVLDKECSTYYFEMIEIY